MMDQLNPRQLDMLCELSNIGVGHAATALSQLLKRPIMLEVPKVSVVDIADVPNLLGGAERLVAGVRLQVLGEARGNILLVVPAKSAGRLVSMLGTAGPDEPLESDLAVSTLCEIGNILASSYLSVLSDMIGASLIPSIPKFAYDMTGAVIDDVLVELGTEGDLALLVETVFFSPRSEKREIRGHFFLLPTAGSLATILRAAGEET